MVFDFFSFFQRKPVRERSITVNQKQYLFTIEPVKKSPAGLTQKRIWSPIPGIMRAIQVLFLKIHCLNRVSYYQLFLSLRFSFSLATVTEIFLPSISLPFSLFIASP